MSGIVLLLIGLVALVLGYILYGGWLVKKWGVGEGPETPAHTMNDGKDYVPAKAPVLLGHHFSSIAGAGPINGPIQAAIFGWLPVFLWVVIGGIFFGAVHDFGSLFASVRHGGKSVGYIIEKNVGARAKTLFLIFAYLVLLLVVAAFGSIVIGTFTSTAMEEVAVEAPATEEAAADEAAADEAATDEAAEEAAPVETQKVYTAAAKANGSTATTSLLFIIVAMVFGFFVYRKNAPMAVSTILGVAGIIICIIIGLKFPLMGVNADIWMLVVFAYIFVASIAPVWILLQPRDYLNSFLLYGMIVAAVIGVFFTNPTINLPAFTGFGGIKGNSQLFPVLFITVACGAISGFHSLVGSGTSSKQLDREKDAKVIGYGGMLIECALAIIALIAVGMLFKDGAMPKGTPVNVFATGVATMLSALLGDASYTVAYNIITLAFSAFCLTSLDTATRLARYMFQEFFVGEDGAEAVNVAGWRKFLANPYVATLITVVVGALLARGGYAAIWPLFGAANQLLAALALLALAAWLGNIGKSNGMLIFPMLFMLVATLSSLVITIKNQFAIITTAATSAAWLQLIFAVLLVVLAVLLAIEGCQTIFGKKKKA